MYIREFVKLDDAINNTSKADIKGFSKNVAMAFNRMKQTIKKELKNAEFAQLVADFRANPIEESESEPEPSESESDSESDSGSLYDSESESGSESGSGSESESESGSEVSDSENSDSDESYYDESYYDSEAMSSDSDFSSDSDSSDSDSDEEPNPKLTGRAKWVLQPKDIEKQKKKEEEKKKKEEEKKRKDEERKKLDKEKSELSDAEADAEVVQKTYETPEKLMTAVRSILETREKRSILSSLMCFLRLGASLVLQSFSELLPFAAELGVKYQLRILSHCIVSQLRSASRSGSLSPADWNGVFELIESMLSLAESHSTLALEFYNVYEAIRGTNTLESDLQDLAASDTPARIEGDLAQYVSQLAADYVRSQQQSDAHSTAYVTRLRDEVRLEGLAARVQRYYAAQPRLCVQMALLRVRLLYFFYSLSSHAQPLPPRARLPRALRDLPSRRAAGGPLRDGARGVRAGLPRGHRGAASGGGAVRDHPPRGERAVRGGARRDADGARAGADRARGGRAATAVQPRDDASGRGGVLPGQHGLRAQLPRRPREPRNAQQPAPRPRGAGQRRAGRRDARAARAVERADASSPPGEGSER